MTSRERLLAAMYCKPVDRVPISTYELVGFNPDAWENREPSYKSLMDAVRELSDCIYMTGFGHKAVERRSTVNEEKSRTQYTEWREGNKSYRRTSLLTPLGPLTCLHRTDDGLYTTWTCEHLLKTVDDIEKYLSIPWNPPEIDDQPVLEATNRLGDNGVVMVSISDPICEAASLFEMGEFLVLAITERRQIKKLLDAIHERQMETLRRILLCDVSDIQFRICGPEYATPPYMSPDDFSVYVTPYLRDIIDAIRRANGYARVHCHGKIRRIVDEVVDAGAQALDPCEPPPDGDMTLAELSSRYGGRVCLMGNIELRELECSDESRIEYLVRQACSDAMRPGGFILMPTAAPINIPLSPKTNSNYISFLLAGAKYGLY